ncbi:hypothetical protein [Hymenobacter cheonanensis]|uniref:hypothetical protein n=1 Tax=Hymenobacter sp. CA2-7 TaxID=3063993 RepID=UPI0027142A1E|nr:hypothetical protein [Hymenobacter sp. CA2-7]MDO7886710.1 hypothetical protein [Hymenobacter sp. CA2-7]
MDERLRLIKIVSEQAQYLMRETGGLLPFAVILDNEGHVRQLILDWEEEHPDARELTVALEAVVKVRLKFKSILGGVVCTDVLYRPNGQAEQQDALQMKHLLPQETEYYFQPYVSVNDKTFVFAEILRDDMSWDRLSALAE